MEIVVVHIVTFHYVTNKINKYILKSSCFIVLSRLVGTMSLTVQIDHIIIIILKLILVRVMSIESYEEAKIQGNKSL